MKSIEEAVRFIFELESIQSKEDLDIWCRNKGRNKLYLYVQELSPEDWERNKAPKERVRFCYQELLTGYKICKNR